jgi:hypothetical protein
MNNKRIYIHDFCEDLNHHKIILYIGDVDLSAFRARLEEDDINHMYRFDCIINSDEERYLMYIENCDLQNLTWPVYEYILDGYSIVTLEEDPSGYYIELDI